MLLTAEDLTYLKNPIWWAGMITSELLGGYGLSVAFAGWSLLLIRAGSSVESGAAIYTPAPLSSR